MGSRLAWLRGEWPCLVLCLGTIASFSVAADYIDRGWQKDTWVSLAVLTGVQFLLVMFQAYFKGDERRANVSRGSGFLVRLTGSWLAFAATLLLAIGLGERTLTGARPLDATWTQAGVIGLFFITASNAWCADTDRLSVKSAARVNARVNAHASLPGRFKMV